MSVDGNERPNKLYMNWGRQIFILSDAWFGSLFQFE